MGVKIRATKASESRPGANTMTEFETATLALRDASLWVALAQVAATLLIGGGQIAIVWFAIRAMQRTGDRRAQEQDTRHGEAMRKLDDRTATEQRHTEAMHALEALITRHAPGTA